MLMTGIPFSPDFKSIEMLKDTGRNLEEFSKVAVRSAPIIFNETIVPPYFKDVW